jgi:hypothetical protein
MAAGISRTSEKMELIFRHGEASAKMGRQFIFILTPRGAAWWRAQAPLSD